METIPKEKTERRKKGKVHIIKKETPDTNYNTRDCKVSIWEDKRWDHSSEKKGMVRVGKAVG